MEVYADPNYANDYLKVMDNYCNYSQKYKGVVPQQNGNWGAQIYTNNQRIWLGTFKSEIEAAVAYDRASLKLRSPDAPRNFPLTRSMLLESTFQSLYNMETVLSMIKDGSYQVKFDDFTRAKTDKDNDQALSLDKGIHSGYSCKFLFQKELTPSDVGKLNRLVIPKKYAVRFFPRIPDENDGFMNDEIHLSCYDTQKRLWKFRYCYWKSSQSFVFTRGWNQFVKDKKLNAKDKITFYLHENVEVPNMGFLVIDTCSSTNNIGTSLKLGVKEDEKSFDDEKMDDEVIDDQRSSVKTKGFKLFGVQINEFQV